MLSGMYNIGYMNQGVSVVTALEIAVCCNGEEECDLFRGDRYYLKFELRFFLLVSEVNTTPIRIRKYSFFLNQRKECFQCAAVL